MKKNNINLDKSGLPIIPTLLFILIIPLLVKMTIIEYPVYRVLWSNNQPTNVNLFTAIKGYGIITIAIIAVILFALNRNKNKRNLFNKYDKMLLVSSIFILVSTLLSKHKYIALWGYKGRAEGFFVLISYLAMVYYTSKVKLSKKNLKWINITVFSLGFILGVFGLSQAFGFDPFKMSWYQNIILASGYKAADLNFNVGDGRVYMTLFNPNYVGSFVALIFGFVLNNLFRDNKITMKILWSVLLVVLGISLIYSKSEAGLVGVLFVIIATLIVNYKYIFRYRKNLIITLMILVVGLTYLAKTDENYNYFKSLGKSFESLKNPRLQKLEVLETEKNYLKILYNDEKLVMGVNLNDAKDFILIDDEGNKKKLEYNEGEKYYYPTSEVLEGLKIYPRIINKQDGYLLVFENRTFRFVFIKDKIWYLNKYDRAVGLDSVESVNLFKGYEHIGSGRFYIWSRSIPLLKKTWLLGYGPDNYVYNFPQMDYVGKNRSNLSMVNTIVDKPHNMYLQYAINIGVIPLLILLAFWGMLLFELFKIVQKEELDDIYLTVAAAAFSSIIGFMAVGMFNDSTVNVSSVFWGIVGLGLAVVNYNRYDHVRFKEEN